MLKPGDRIRFPDPRQAEVLTEGTFVDFAPDQPIKIPPRVGGVPARIVEAAWVRRDDGTTERVIQAWITPV